MGLSGLAIYKQLPKTNCRDCGLATCMAFAMQVAAGKISVERCPHLSPDVAASLEQATAPPVQEVCVGVGSRAITVGGETVLYRHERRFEHAPALVLMLDDTLSDEQFTSLLGAFESQSFERVGEELRVQMVGVASKDEARLKARALAACATGAPVMIMSAEAAALRAAASAVASSRPLLHAADLHSIDELARFAADKDLPLVVRGNGLEEAAALAKRARELGVSQVVIDSGAQSPAFAFRDLVLARRAAVLEGRRELGHPLIVFPDFVPSNPLMHLVLSAVFVCKYASFVVIRTIDPACVYPLLTLSQNIYSDPQRPMQVSPGIYPINNPGAESPVLITTNFSLTYYIVSGEVENSRVPAWLLVMDVDGQSVLTAWAAGKFVPEAIAPFVRTCGIADQVNHRRLTIPGYVAHISGDLAEELGAEWRVDVGPREAADLPHYLRTVVST